MLRALLSQTLAVTVWALTRVFYRHHTEWVTPPPPEPWKGIRVFALLNHTSLMEPLFFGAFPPQFLWDAAARAVVPGADITLKRPLVGRFYRYFSPRTVSITRQRDDSWQHFLAQIDTHSLVAIAPEGRMMRANGLDKEGKPMSVRGGIADILLKIGQGRMLLAYSGGLHHVNRPGERRLAFFKTLRLRLECLEIADYLASFGEREPSSLRLAVARDLEARLARHRPPAEA
ncbi:MAG: hypothetical protein ACO1RX_03620 [Candidatus Sericytochromatia bacterium]